MSEHEKGVSTPFGTPLGIAEGGVVSYSSDYKTVNETKYPGRHAFRSYHDGI